MKKLIYAALCLGLCLSFAACGDKTPTTQLPPSPPPASGSDVPTPKPVYTAADLPLLSPYGDKVFSVWSSLDKYSELPQSVMFNNQQVSLDEVTFSYTSLGSSDTSHMIKISSRYNFSVRVRGEYVIGELTNLVTGESGYYYSLSSGADRSWPEYIYPRAVHYLDQCLQLQQDGEEVWFYSDLEEGHITYKGNDAWKKLYEIFEFLGDYRDSRDYLSRFTVLEDMFVGTGGVTYYPDGNVKTTASTILGLDDMILGDSWNTKEYIYDENGRLERVRITELHLVLDELILQYDENGFLTGAVSMGGSAQNRIYKCDEKGRITEASYYYISHYYYAFTYDEQDKLTKIVSWSKDDHDWITRCTTTYEYDPSGLLTGKYSLTESEDSGEFRFANSETSTFEHNEAEKTIRETVYRKNWDGYEQNYERNFRYEDLYFFE